MLGSGKDQTLTMDHKKIIVFNPIKTATEKRKKRLVKVKDIAKTLSCYHFTRKQTKALLKILQQMGIVRFSKKAGYIEILDSRFLILLNKNKKSAWKPIELVENHDS